MINNFKVIIFGLLMGAVSLGMFFPKKTPKPLWPSPSARRIFIGAWTEGFYDPGERKLHPEILRKLEQTTGKKFSLAHYYLGWEELDNPEFIRQLDLIHQSGWTPVVNVNPYYFSKCPASEMPLYRAIARGKCDVFLHRIGKNIARARHPFYFLFAWEMNNEQNEWSIIRSGSAANDFIAAWRHLHDIFQAEKAVLPIWVFCPNVPETKSLPYASLYPGGRYVNWTGLDGYNWGTSQTWSRWLSFREIFQGSYQKLLAIAPDKPVLIAEVNSADQGGDKSAWLKDMFVDQIPKNFLRVNAVSIFNEDRSRQENVNWRIDTTPAYLKSFSLAVKSPLYQ